MNMYYYVKKNFLGYYLRTRAFILRYNLSMTFRKDIKDLLKKNKTKKLSKEEIKQVKDYYKSRGYKRVNLDWHRFYTDNNKTFLKEYIPEDIFHAIVSTALNETKQWPALLDKNLLGVLFGEFKQPCSVAKNINGFYYIGEKQVAKKEIIDLCNTYKGDLVIKPSIESGRGRGVLGFSVDHGITNYKDWSIDELLNQYKKDFIIQKVVSQHPTLKKLNPTSLNTLRIMTYLKDQEVHILSGVIRIGRLGEFIDNSYSGGMVCGINEEGNLRDYGYFFREAKRQRVTDTNINLNDIVVPSYAKALDMVKKMHFKIPYFKIISWDIGIDDTNTPVLIEYNTYQQGIGIHQVTNGPLFGKFTDEILEAGKSLQP